MTDTQTQNIKPVSCQDVHLLLAASSPVEADVVVVSDLSLCFAAL